MKILQITPYYYPHLGGVETHVKSLSEELVKQGHEVTVLTHLHSIALRMEDNRGPVKIIRINTEPKIYNPLTYKLTVWQQMAKQAQLMLAADVIHVHDVMWWMIPLLPLLWSKIYLTFHGWEGIYPVPWRYKLARWCWSKLALKTIHVGAYIQHFYWDKPDLVVYGGVRAKKKVSLHRQNKKLKIVFLGRLEAENSLDKYLDLAKKLQSQLEFEITWVGDGIYREDCQKLGQVIGMVKDVTPYLKQADLVWSASYLSILEAQALGKVACSFYDHPLKEKYLKLYPNIASMLVEYKVSQLEQQILRLVRQPKIWQKFAQRAYNWSSQQTWKKMANQYQKLWGFK